MGNAFRQAIGKTCRQDEAACVAALLDAEPSIPYDRMAVTATARHLVEAVRKERRHAGGVDQLMHEFSLSSQEGIALMCLAEALLRIPDRATADRLIRDKLSHGDWAAHLGHRHSLFVHAATWGLLITGKLVATHSHTALGSALGRLLTRSGEPIIRKGMALAMRLLGQQFVMGETIEEALARAEDGIAQGYTHSFDMLGEAALTTADAERYTAAYRRAIQAIGQAAADRGIAAGPGISVKLSALHPRYQRSQWQRVMGELRPRLKGLMVLAKGDNIGLNIDAEEADRLELSLDLLESLADDPELADWAGMGFVVQAYQKRCPQVIDFLIDLARRSRRRLMIRLVKGAYWDSEIKRCQVDGLPDYPVYTRKAHTDLAYLVCADKLLTAPDAIYPQFATHNAHTLATVLHIARARGIDDYEFQCLHGMGEALYDQVVGPGKLAKPCRIYAPVGSHETLLPYLVRRLLENGANTSFVNRLVDEQVTIEALLADPRQTILAEGGPRHPAIPLPSQLYGPQRQNSAGLDLADEATLAHLATALPALAQQSWRAVPLVPGTASSSIPEEAVANPADTDSPVGTLTPADTRQMESALANGAAASQRWHATPPTVRAACLLRAAGLLEAHRDELLSLCIREAGKTIPNALAEVREAVDFCRYYAAQIADNRWRQPTRAPGLVVCISPWNFPLAIFLGEVVASLAAGSPVIAKPAEQTPLIAFRAVQLLHQAGIPTDALQFLPGPGATLGARLVADGRVQGVVFTGSTEVARHIQQAVAPRGNVRLIAETGGQNAMIVDASALPEQVVQDVLTSGFDSAGQRCSALRVLCLQQEIADLVLAKLKAAMATLVVGNPADLASDIGPVIDHRARVQLLAHIATMEQQGYPVYRPPLPAACTKGSYLAPTLIEIDSLQALSGEVFGPVVHILRFSADELPALVDSINATGYGLTLGIHSRIDETVETIIRHARVGNIYVNRNMVGAVVGVQPFGGEGLSGTGPKAGGPLYLHRLADTPRVKPQYLGTAPSPDLPPPLLALINWAATRGEHVLATQARQDGMDSLLGITIPLPGPTGERNILSFAPRGKLLCLATSRTSLLHQLAAVLATGNTPCLPEGEVIQALLTELPETIREKILLWNENRLAGIDGILATPEDSTDLERRAAARNGPLLPIYRSQANTHDYPLHRLVVERVVTTNTTAAGGNTSLITLGD